MHRIRWQGRAIAAIAHAPECGAKSGRACFSKTEMRRAHRFREGDMVKLYPSSGSTALFKQILKTGVATLAVAGITPAMAQSVTTAAPATTPPPGAPDTKPDDDSTIVVSGYGRSLQNAIKEKKLSVEIVESISAEDVGKLPDVSIADALSRLPGLAVQEESGRATYLTINGFGPDFLTGTLNGRVLASVDDNRRFDFSLFPGDLFEKIDVRKTPAADEPGYGLAGEVDLKTYDPLTHKKTFSINIQGSVGQYGALNPGTSNKGYKSTLIYVNRFADDTIGVSFGISAIKDPQQNESFNTGGAQGNYGNVGTAGNVAAGAIGTNTLGAITPTDLQNYVRTNTLYRQTAFGHVVYHPDDKFEMALDGFYTQSKIREYARGWEMPIPYGWSNDKATSIQATNGYVTSATWSVYPVLRNDYNTSDASTWGIGWNAKYGVSDDIKLLFDVNASHAHRHDNNYEIYAGTSNNGSGAPATANITRQPDGTYSVAISGVNFADPTQVSLTDPQGWNQVGFNNVPDIVDSVKGLRAELEGKFHSSVFKSWEVGAFYNDEKKTSDYSGYYICLPGPASVAGCGADNAQVTSVAIPQSIIQGSISPYGVTGTNIIAVNPLAAQSLLRTAPQTVTNDVTRDWTVEERVLTGFAQVNFDTSASGMAILGNVGAQIVHTAQLSLGNSALTNTAYSTEYYSTEYTYFLPSASASIEVAHNAFVKLGASRTLARAKLADENASYTVSYISNTGGFSTVPSYLINGKQPIFSGSGGNPYLRPYFSDNLDLSLEKYFAHDQGKIAIHGFYKFISNYVGESVLVPANFAAYTGEDTNGLLTNPATASEVTTLGWNSAPENNGRGHVDGFDISAVLPIGAMVAQLQGFGVSGNYAYSQSSVNFIGVTTPITLPGLSKNVFQAVAWFERGGFNSRVSYNYRSAYLGDYFLFSALLTSNETKAQSFLDAQIGYDFKSGPLNGLSLYVQAHNLTNSKTISYVNNDPNQVNIRSQYGAQYLAGATFKF
jgi:iron complex outermembrane receptor protein